MGKSSPAGNTTVTQNNAPWVDQQPYLDTGFSQAQNLLNNSPLNYYPGQTLATPDSQVPAAYYQMEQLGENTAAYTTGLAGPAQAAALTGLTGFENGENVANNPAARDLAGVATGTGPLTSALATTASGAYLNPGSNPYESGEFNAAAQPVINAYQTATAPQTDSQMEAAGRYGSGAMANAQSINEQNLGTTLNNLSSNIYGTDYENALGVTAGAQNNLATIGTTALGDLGSQYNTGEAQDMLAIGQAPSITSLPSSDLNLLEAGGQGITGLSQAQINDQMASYYGNEQAPYNTLQSYLGDITGNYGSAGSTTTPYFTNPVGSALATGTGALSLANGVNSATSAGGVLGGLFGGTAGSAGSAAGDALAGADYGTAGKGAADVAADAAGGMF